MIQNTGGVLLTPKLSGVGYGGDRRQYIMAVATVFSSVNGEVSTWRRHSASCCIKSHSSPPLKGKWMKVCCFFFIHTTDGVRLMFIPALFMGCAA